MMWPKPSLLSKHGEVGQEVLYAEEHCGEQTHLRAWKAPYTQTSSDPVTTQWREEHHGGGTVCVGEHGTLLPLRSSWLSSGVQMFTHAQGLRWEQTNKSDMTPRMAFLDRFPLLQQITILSTLFPLNFLPEIILCLLIPFSTHGSPEENYKATVSDLSSLRIRNLPSSLRFEHSAPNICSI